MSDDRVEFESALFSRSLGDGLFVIVYPMLFGNVRLCLGDRYSVLDAYCYESREVCLRAAREWSGEGDPLDGWVRHPFSGRRRKHGDPSTEERRF